MDAKNIGSNRQLFVDQYWIDHLKGVVRKLPQPVRQEIVIESDKPWDQSPSAAGFIQECSRSTDKIATRKASQLCLDAYGPEFPEFL